MRHRNKLASTIANSELLYLFGSGGSGQIAEEAALKLLSFGFRTFVFADPG
jgi:DNA-binding MurR/RpiR family transcriptional regulator